MSLLSSCAGLCLLAAANAEAPLPVETDDTQTVGEIVVLGRRATPRDLTLGAGPVTDRMSPSSRSIESDLLQAVGATRLSDALELVSNVSQQNNRGGVMDNFAVRGFLGTPDGGAEYYVDGFLANRGMAPPRDPATAERIEVLKGPAGALFGDIDPAGRINIVSKTPRFAPDAVFTGTVGSFGLRRGELDVTGPISDSLAGRLVLAGETSEGGRDNVGMDRTSVAPSLTWRPNDALRLTYVGEFTVFSTLFDRGMPAVNGDALALPESNYYGEPSDGTTRFRNERHQITGEYRINGDWSLNGGIAWRGGSLKGLSSDHSRLVGETLWRQRRGRDFTVEDLSARLELNGVVATGLGVHNLGFGVKAYELTYGEKWLRINPNAANPYPIDLFDPVYGAVPSPTPLPFTDNLETREVVTVYAQDLWEVNDRLSLVAGLRYDDYSQTIRNNRTGAVGENEDSPVDYRLAARYRLTDALTAHASYGQSFVLNSGTGRTGAGFAPEEGKGYEVGLSGAWDGLDLAATVFDIEKTNILTSDPVDPNYLAPVGKLTTRGIELDGSLRVDDWQVVANYAWTDAKADDAAFASEDVLNVPEHSGSLFVIGRFPTAHGTDWSMTAGAAYVGDRAGTLAADGVRLPAYWKAKAAVEYGLTSQVTARVEVDNLFDERYAASSYSALWIFPGAPRSVRASLRVAL